MKIYLLQLLFLLVVCVDQYLLLNVHIVTWNVNEKKPPEGLKELFSTDTTEVDVYAIGLQEVSPVFALWNKNEKKWLSSIRTFFIGRNYEQLGKISITGSMLTVFVKISVRNQIENVETSHINKGVLGIAGNKGGTGLRFDLNGTSYCFVNTHLPAHDDQYAKRVQDYNAISEKLTFGRSGENIEDHDLVFWFGDLNFRLDDVRPEEVLKILNKAKDSGEVARALIGHDQLKKAMHKKEAFGGYKEEGPLFYPSYKFEVGTSKYNWKRKPAWTDRILYKIRDVRLVQVHKVKYTSLMNYKISDHKPVVATFEITFPN